MPPGLRCWPFILSFGAEKEGIVYPIASLTPMFNHIFQFMLLEVTFTQLLRKLLKMSLLFSQMQIPGTKQFENQM